MPTAALDELVRAIVESVSAGAYVVNLSTATGEPSTDEGANTQQALDTRVGDAGSLIVIEPERGGRFHATKGSTMVKAVVLYGPPQDPDVFERYYAETHTALAKAIPGLQRFEAAQGIATPDGGAVPYQRIAELTFEDMTRCRRASDPSRGRRPSTTSRTSPPAG